jgi:hypothetical protein
VPPPGPSGLRGFRGQAAAGEAVGTFDQRWLLVPPDYRALPHTQPPAVAWDPTRSQRFVMLDGFCRLGDAGDAFRGFGTGRTFPRGGGRVDVAAVGTLVEGLGRLADRVGTYTVCGTLDPARGFSGNVLLRVSDPAGELQTDGGLPPFAPSAEAEPGISYLLLRGQKRDKSQHTAYRFGRDGDVIGLDVEQDVRLFHLDASPKARGGLKCLQRIGPIVGRMTARIAFNLLNPEAPGTDLAPIPFASFNDFTVFDAAGAVLGTLAADGVEGRTFQLALPGAPGQRALRFGGFGPVVSGTGAFSGVSGLFTDNSAVGVAPHALATSYVFRLDDPEGRFRF